MSTTEYPKTSVNKLGRLANRGINITSNVFYPFRNSLTNRKRHIRLLNNSLLDKLVSRIARLIQ
jgi:hypothetical protein